MVLNKFLLECRQPFGDLIFPLYQNEEKGHCLLVLICVLGMLKLEPKLFAGTLIYLT